MTYGIRHLIREALLWACGLIAVLLAFYFFHDIREAVMRSRESAITARISEVRDRKPYDMSRRSDVVRIQQDAAGHYSTDAAINGHVVPVLVDTGASLVVLTFEDAGRIGLFPNSLEFSGKVKTANGIAKVAPVRLDRVQVGGILLQDVPAMVAAPGVLHQNLLGMSFLRKLMRFQIENRQLILAR